MYYSLHASIACVGIFISIFTRRLLNVKQYNKLLDSILIFITVVFILLAILVIIDIYFYQWLVYFSFFSDLVMIGVALHALTQKVNYAIFYAISLGAYQIGLFTIAAYSLGFLPYSLFTRYSFLIGSFVEMFVFSLALAYRFKQLYQDQKVYQEKLLSAQRQQNANLESLVAERTSDLTASNKQLVELSNFKTDLTNMIIHDLQTPLDVIINAKAIQDETTKLSMIQQAGYRMRNLIRNILDIYRSDAAEIRLHIQEIPLNEIIDEALNEVVFLLEQKSITLDINTHLRCIVQVDRDLIKRVFINLLTNAVRHSPSNEVIAIIITACDSSTVQVAVRNVGPKIPSELHEVIFEKYKQVNGGNRDASKTTGLGLAYCKLAIEAHEGKLGVNPKCESGVEFWFTLPNSRCWESEMSSSAYAINPLIQLTKKEGAYLLPFTQRLSEYSTFNVWELNKILDEVKVMSKEVEVWKQQLEEAVYAGNEVGFKKLLSLQLPLVKIVE